MINLDEYFGLHKNETSINAFGSGLINHTWLVECGAEKFILQAINKNVFSNPLLIDENINAISNYLKQNHRSYFLPTPIVSTNGNTLVKQGDEYYRLFKFVQGSITYNVLSNPQQAYEAAKQFGKFTRLLSGFDISKLNCTIPDFHNLNFRYQQFQPALQNTYRQRLSEAGDLINKIEKYKNIVDKYNEITHNKNFKQRVTHHDTKISNVLFNKEGKGICVIDLDTVMPGYFISDVGDMMRTYLSAASEEETDMSKVFVRDEYFKAVVDGYISEMKDELSPDEKNCFIYSGKFMIYMQALRFAADFLTGDTYYGAKYPQHNLNRAINQITLLESLIDKEEKFKNII